MSPWEPSWEELEEKIIKFKKAKLKRFTATFSGSGDEGQMELLDYECEEDEEFEEDEEDEDIFYFGENDILALADSIAKYHYIYEFEGVGSWAKLEVDLYENKASWETIWYAREVWERIGKLSFKEALKGIPKNEHQEVLKKLESNCSSLISSLDFFDPESYKEDLGAYGTLLDNIADECSFRHPLDGYYIAEDDEYADDMLAVYEMQGEGPTNLEIDVRIDWKKRTIEVYQSIMRSVTEKKEITLIED